MESARGEEGRVHGGAVLNPVLADRRKTRQLGNNERAAHLRNGGN